MDKTALMSAALPNEIPQGLLACKALGFSDGLIARMCLTTRGQIRRWRDGDVAPRNFQQVLLVVRALLGTEHSPVQMGAGTLAQETPTPEDEEAIDPSLLEDWDEFMARRQTG